MCKLLVFDDLNLQETKIIAQILRITRFITINPIR